MLLRYSTLLVLAMMLYCLSAGAFGMSSAKMFSSDEEVIYSYSNDKESSISVNFKKRNPISEKEEWVILLCVTKNPFAKFGYDTTNTATLSSVVQAVSASMEDFTQSHPGVLVANINCSPTITNETFKTFGNWIDSAPWDGNEKSRFQGLKDRIETYTFEPLVSALAEVFQKYRYTLRVHPPESKGFYSKETAQEYAEKLKRENIFYYLELQQAP